MTNRYHLSNLFIKDLLHIFDWEKNTMVQKKLIDYSYLEKKLHHP